MDQLPPDLQTLELSNQCELAAIEVVKKILFTLTWPLGFIAMLYLVIVSHIHSVCNMFSTCFIAVEDNCEG